MTDKPLCVDCRHYDDRAGLNYIGGPVHVCAEAIRRAKRGGLASPVTGCVPLYRQFSCEEQREHEPPEYCSPAGNWFEPKVTFRQRLRDVLTILTQWG